MSWRIKYKALPYWNVSVCSLLCYSIVFCAFFVYERILFIHNSIFCKLGNNAANNSSLIISRFFYQGIKTFFLFVCKIVFIASVFRQYINSTLITLFRINRSNATEINYISVDCICRNIKFCRQFTSS